MPRVPTYDRRTVAPQPLASPRVTESVSPSAFGADIGRGLQQVGNVVFDIQQREREKADRAAVVEADNQLDTFEQSALFDPDEGAFTKSGKDAFDLPNQVLPQYDEEATRIEGTLGSDTAKAAFRARSLSRRQAINQRLNQHELNEREKFYDQQDKAKLDSSRALAANYYSDPERIAGEIRTQEETIEAFGKRKGSSREQIDAAKAEARSTTHADVIDRYLARDEWRKGQIYFEEVRDQLSGDAATRVESALTTARKAAEREAKASLAEARQALSDEIRDIQAAALAGLPVTSAPSRATLQAVFGEREGAQRFDTINAFVKAGAEVAGFHDLPTAELAGAVAALAPKQVEGAEAQAQLHGFAERAAAEIVKVRDKDPAQYIASSNKTIAAAYEAAQRAPNDPELAQAYARATIAEQQRLGVTQLAVLPKAQISAFADQFFQRREGGESYAAIIAREQERWGRYWPDVFGQLQAEKIPGAVLAIGRGMAPGPAARLANVASVPREDLVKGIETPQRDVTEAIERKLGEFIASVDGVVGAEATSAGMYDAIERLTYVYLRQGSGITDAAKQAYSEVLGDHYAFYQVNGRTFRVPVEQDVDDVENAAEAVLDSVKAQDLLPPIPTDMSASEVALDDLTRALRRRGYWVTSVDNESGLALFLDGAPVLRQDGTVFELTWDELRSAATAIRQGQREAIIRQKT